MQRGEHLTANGLSTVAQIRASLDLHRPAAVKLSSGWNPKDLTLGFVSGLLMVPKGSPWVSCCPLNNTRWLFFL